MKFLLAAAIAVISSPVSSQPTPQMYGVFVSPDSLTVIDRATLNESAGIRRAFFHTYMNKPFEIAGKTAQRMTTYVEVKCYAGEERIAVHMAFTADGKKVNELVTPGSKWVATKPDTIEDRYESVLCNDADPNAKMSFKTHEIMLRSYQAMVKMHEHDPK